MMGHVGAVYCIVLVDDNFHYPLIPSNPLWDLSELIFKVFKNAVLAKSREQYETKAEQDVKKIARQVLDICLKYGNH